MDNLKRNYVSLTEENEILRKQLKDIKKAYGIQETKTIIIQENIKINEIPKMKSKNIEEKRTMEEKTEEEHTLPTSECYEKLMVF